MSFKRKRVVTAEVLLDKKRPNPALLLMPNVPPPLHGIAPRVVMGDGWWDIQRKAAYAKANYKCDACGVPKEKAKFHKWLEAHEQYEIDFTKGRMTFLSLVALCHACHNYIHSGRLQLLLEQGEIDPTRVRAIMEHGDYLTTARGFVRPHVPTLIAAWKDWRMVFNGKEYGPSTPNAEAWERGEWKNWRP